MRAFRSRWVLVCILGCFGTTATLTAGDPPCASPDQVWQELKKGNERYSQDAPSNPNCSQQRRSETAKGQHPMAAIVACADSRVPVERVFDQGIGDLFVVRVAGNVCDTDTLGSVEYGIEHLHTPLMVVLGHSKCGAVTAVCENAPLQGHVRELTAEIKPAVAKARQTAPNAQGPELVSESIRQNVLQGIADTLRRSAIAREHVQHGKLKIVGGVYDIESGKIIWLGEHPQQALLLGQTSETRVAGEKATRHP